MNGMVAIAYMGMANGSPYVVPSLEYSTSPSMNSLVGAIYELMRAVASGGQSLWMFSRTVSQLRELNVLLPSTSRMASVSSC